MFVSKHEIFFVLVVLVETIVDSSQFRYNLGIMKGNQVPEGKYPFIASILFKYNKDGFKHLCTGSIINDVTVMTAAHCLKSKDTSNYRVLIGQIYWPRKTIGYYYNIDNITVHPSYNESLKGFDIGLIKSKSKFQFNDHIGKVCLASPISKPDTTKCMAIGWGRTQTTGKNISDWLNEATIPLQNDSVCLQYAKSMTNVEINSKSIICAGNGMVGGPTTCNGDSGGPFICQILKNPKRWLQFGISSFGFTPGGKCVANYTYFTRVSQFIDWTVDNAEN